MTEISSVTSETAAQPGVLKPAAKSAKPSLLGRFAAQYADISTPFEVILPDGRSLNRELVRAGLAWWYRHYAPRDRELGAP